MSLTQGCNVSHRVRFDNLPYSCNSRHTPQLAANTYFWSQIKDIFDLAQTNWVKLFWAQCTLMLGKCLLQGFSLQLSSAALSWRPHQQLIQNNFLSKTNLFCSYWEQERYVYSKQSLALVYACDNARVSLQKWKLSWSRCRLEKQLCPNQQSVWSPSSPS